MTARSLLTPSQSLLQSPLQLLSELPPDHELYLPEEAKPNIKPVRMATSQMLKSMTPMAASSSSPIPVSTPHSTCSMKMKCDYIADIHEQGHAEQAQTDHEASQLHEVHMARIEASTQRKR